MHRDPQPAQDWSDPRHAEALCKGLTLLWLERGYRVRFWVEVGRFRGKRGNPRRRRADIRSDLINGLPPPGSRIPKAT